jgi:hypothetical protein
VAEAYSVRSFLPTSSEVGDEPLLALDAALTRLAAEDALAARVIELRHFAGLSIDDAATAPGLSRAAAYRRGTYARAWLRDAISGPNRAEKHFFQIR